MADQETMNNMDAWMVSVLFCLYLYVLLPSAAYIVRHQMRSGFFESYRYALGPIIIFSS